ncbi:hypothetical protein BH23VER1_BH23VER1_07320 [soil metagenome]
MATKSKRAKTRIGGEEDGTPAKSVAKQREEALSLFDEKPAPRRRGAKRIAEEEEAARVAEEAATAAANKPEKKEALSLFEDEERRQESRAKGGRKILDEKEIERRSKRESALPPISLLKASDEEARRARLRGESPAMTAAAAEAVPAPDEIEEEAAAEAADAGDREGGDGADEGGDEGAEPDADGAKIIHIKPPIIVKDLAERMGLKPFLLIKDLIELDVFADTNKSIEPEIATKLCEKYGFVFEKERRAKGAGVHKVEEVVVEPAPPEEEPEDELELRAPIVTFMGHVDHGKTSLLDAIRKESVTAGEAGGITQHIGAYSIEHDGKRITFLDTPGHAAFSRMRARGADVTDIVVLVVAADDGIMPQTVEAMDHAKAAGVKIMVAVNKIDVKNASPDRVKQQLQKYDLAPEEWGGSTQVVDVSTKTGEGIDALLDMMSLEAEMLELQANPDAIVRAPIIEARVVPGRGPSATVIVQMGTLRIGTPFICGPIWGKVKSLINDKGEPVTEAGPSTPVEVIGFDSLPHVGDELVEMESERAAKKLGDERQADRRQEKLGKPTRSSLDKLLAGGAGLPKLRIVLKADVQGSVEAILGSLEEIESAKIDLEVLHSGAGAVTESDILLASASDAIVIGFNTKVESKAVKVAKSEGVQVKLYSIIYELLDQVREALLGMLAPEHRETVIGHAEVKQIFRVSRTRIGGCMVIDGRINRGARARVLRDGQPVYDGGLATLRRFTEDVNEVRNGLECGIKLGDFNEYEVGDIIECYELEKLQQTL